MDRLFIKLFEAFMFIILLLNVLFHCVATKKGLKQNELKIETELFLSKGQPCFRSSLLTKRYGWGIHSNEEGKVALFGVETDEYKKLVNGKT